MCKDCVYLKERGAYIGRCKIKGIVSLKDGCMHEEKSSSTEIKINKNE